MRILVTGGAGYIGSVICEELLRERHDVVVIDNLSRGHKEAVVEGATFVQLDLLDPSLGAVIKQHQIEAVIHMAASSLVGESVQKPREYYRNNVEAGLALLNAMCDAGVRRIVFSSTAAVYGEPAKQPIEESDPTAPTNPYGETKLTFERILDWYSRAYGISYTSLRYFNAAGATAVCGEDHDPESHLIPAALLVAAGRRPHLEIFGDDYPTRDGTCVRDYIHVLDLARAHILALQNFRKGNRIFNLGCGGTGYTVREVVEAVKAASEVDIPVRIAARRPGDPAVLIASSEKIKKELGWNPVHQDLSRIIQSAWDWMKAHPHGYRE